SVCVKMTGAFALAVPAKARHERDTQQHKQAAHRLFMLGAPFWFDLLTKLVSLRGAGPKPSPAPEDPSSATAIRAAATEQPAPASLQAGSDWKAALRSALGAAPARS